MGKKERKNTKERKNMRGVKTKRLRINAQINTQNIKRAVTLIKNSQIVAFPTETVYGLGANTFDATAVAKIFKAKGRPADNPLIVHISNASMLKLVVKKVPVAAQQLIDEFWPGPLSIVFEKKNTIPSIVTAGLSTVVVRMPNHPVALRLIQESGVPVAAPSATTAMHVRDDFPNVFVLDGGNAKHGLESTVIDVRGRVPKVLRLGAITLEQLRRVVPAVIVAKHTAKKPASPGMKYRHYAPSRPLYVFKTKKELLRYAKQGKEKRGSTPIILCMNNDQKYFSQYTVLLLGRTLDDVAHNIFSALRTKQKGDCLLMLAVPKKGKGSAVMDRVERAAMRIR